ncbi:hypothetical protein HYW75_05540 [Candidatus Pacearchaeota archaeon]|nr:hypothetical protein [Candidatus Pacearchaeota archaeon]
MAKAKKSKSKDKKPTYVEFHFVIPVKKRGFPSDTRVMETLLEINKQRHIDIVASDQSQAYSLAYRFCSENGIDFLSNSEDLIRNPNFIDDLIDLYQKRSLDDPQKSHPNIAYLTSSGDYDTLSAIAKNLAAKGVKTEIRKVF